MIFTKCEIIVDRVSDIIDKEASLMSRMGFYSHLMMCSNCRRYFDQFKKVKESLGRVTPDDLPGDFDRVMNFVMGEIVKKNKPQGKPKDA